MNSSDLNSVTVGLFADAFAKNPAEVPLSEILGGIRSGRWSQKIAKARKLFERWQAASPDQNSSLEATAYSEHKKTLPAFFVSGWSPARKGQSVLERHSNLLQIDLDKLGPKLGAVRERVRNDPHVLFGFVSPSGAGLKLGLVIDGARHRDSFLSAETYFKATYGLGIDQAVKDQNRLCFVSHDPDAWISDQAAPLPITVEQTPAPIPPETNTVAPGAAIPARPPSTGRLSREQIAESQLAVLAPDAYDVWRDVGFALKSGFGEAGWPLFDAWSRRCPDKYNQEANRKLWDAFSQTGGITLGTMEHMAKQAGWTFPRASRASTPPRRSSTGPSEYLPSDEEYADSLAGGGVELEVPSEIALTPAVIEAIPIGLLERPPENDPAELLKYRFLCERGSLLIPGPTGMGKSSFILQCLALWANKQPAFGIIPARFLTSVIIQAENDDGDMAEMRDGICSGLELTASQREAFFTRVLVYSSAGLTGRHFCERIVKPILERHHPNLLCIDPALSYMGGDTRDQKDVGSFLRVHLNPLIFANKCASMLIHHTNKPLAGKEKPNWKNGEFAYLGSGSAEWANWARAVLSLQATGTTGVYSLHAAKRGGRIGWKDQEGVKIYEKLIKHTSKEGVICWQSASENDLETTSGRPRAYDQSEILDILSEHSLSTSDWFKAAYDQFGISQTSFKRARRDLQQSQKINLNKITNRWEKLLPRDTK